MRGDIKGDIRQPCPVPFNRSYDCDKMPEIHTCTDGVVYVDIIALCTVSRPLSQIILVFFIGSLSGLFRGQPFKLKVCLQLVPGVISTVVRSKLTRLTMKVDGQKVDCSGRSTFRRLNS